MEKTLSSQASDWREGRRLRAFELKEWGWKQTEIADALGIMEGAVSQWTKRAREEGLEGLRHKPLPGATLRLSEEERAELSELLAQGVQLPQRARFRDLEVYDEFSKFVRRIGVAGRRGLRVGENSVHSGQLEDGGRTAEIAAVLRETLGNAVDMVMRKGSNLSIEITRRRFLGAVTAGTAWIALTGTLGCEPASRTRAIASTARGEQTWAFRSRPEFSPPSVEVTTQAHNTAPGYVFVSPKKEPGETGPSQDAPLIVDDSGEPVWFHPLQGEEKDAFDFKVQSYRGEPVLTWWEGHHTGFGQGEYVLLDRTYREITRVHAGNGFDGDHHEFLITPEDTALFTIYNKVPMDLSSAGGPKDGVVLDGIVQEVDVETGEVLFEWHSLEHVALDESYYEPREEPEGSFDYFHINSVDVDGDGHLLVSARRTSTVYKIDRETGEIVWRLGGKKTDFEMGWGTWTDYQHDARRHSDGTVTIFDNGSVNKDAQSRGIVLELDEEAMSATLVAEYTHPEKVFSDTQGNVQVLPNGNAFVGWGSEPFFSEFSHDGRLLFDASFPPELESYRAFRFPWKGYPQNDPAVTAELGPDDEMTLYASWNGATEVATWEVLVGPSPDRLKPTGSAPRKGFETAITVHTEEPYVGVRAKHRSGTVLGVSKAVKPRN